MQSREGGTSTAVWPRRLIKDPCNTMTNGVPEPKDGRYDWPSTNEPVSTGPGAGPTAPASR